MPLPATLSLKNSDNASGNDARVVRFCESLDQGLSELRSFLVQSFSQHTDISPTRIVKQDSPWIVDGRYHVPPEKSPWVTPRRDIKPVNSPGTQGQCEATVAKGVANSTVYDDASKLVDCKPLDSTVDCEGGLSPTYPADCWSNAEPRYVSDHSKISNRSSRSESNVENWGRFVQRIVTLARVEFHMLPCWAPPCDDTEATASVVLSHINEVGKETQDVDAILHFWNLQQNKAMPMRAFILSAAMNATPDIGLNGNARHRCIFHPLGEYRVFWGLLGLVCILYDGVMISLHVFDLGESATTRTLDWVLRVYWLLDMGVCFRTGFYIKSVYQDSPRAIARHYILTWFAIDAVAVIPDWIITLLEDSSDLGDVSQTFRYLKVFKMIRLVRVAKVANWVQNFMESVNSIHLLLAAEVLKNSVLVLCWMHCCAVTWYAVAKGLDESWLTKNNLAHLRLPDTYLISLQWAFAQLQGSTDIVASFSGVERAVHSVLLVLSIFVLAVFISNITNTLIQLQTAWDEKARHLRAIQDYLYRHQVSPQTSESVRKYSEEKLKIERKLHLGEDEVTDMLPNVLRRSLLVEVRKNMINDGSPVFTALAQFYPKSFERLCCDIISPHFVAPDLFVYSYGEECTHTLFNIAGQLVYDHINNAALSDFMKLLKKSNTLTNKFHQKSATGDLSNVSSSINKSFLRDRLKEKGAILESIDVEARREPICEATMWTSWTHCGDMTAISHTAFLRLPTTGFQSVVESDLVLQKFGVTHAVRFCRVLSYLGYEAPEREGQRNPKQPEVSDLLTSNDVLNVLFEAGEISEKSKRGGNSSSSLT